MFELFTSGRRNPEIAAEFAELQRATRTRLAELLAARQAQGAVRLADEPEAVAAVLLSLADGFALRLLGEPGTDHGPALRAATAAARAPKTRTRDIPDVAPAAREREAAAMRNQRSLVVAAGIAALLIPATAAQAATKQVTIGPAKPLAGVPPVAFDADFYPRKITIAKGDHIRFKWTTGFGDVIFVPEGQDAPSFAMPTGTVAGAKDEAGADLWFNGQPSFAPNMEALSPQGGKVIDGSKVVGSGFSFEGPMKPWKVRFTKAGTYRLSERPDADQAAHGHGQEEPQRRARQEGRQAAPGQAGQGEHEAREEARGLRRPGGQRGARRQRRQGHRADRLLPREEDRQGRRHGEVRDVEVVDRAPQRRLRPQAVSRRQAVPRAGAQPVRGLPLATRRARRSASTAPTTATATSTPGSSTPNKNSPFPSNDSVTFTKAGTYTYYCAVHGNDMKGEIVVR